MSLHQPIDTPRSSSPFGRGWIPASRDIGIPGDDAAGASAASEEDPRLAHFVPRPVNLPHSAFSPERRIHFLDTLARDGNVRAACLEIGISPQAAYMARRRDPRFAAGWDAALLLARDHAEAVLADRALNGVEEIIFHRGKMVGRRVKFDNRLLLALLGRLDKRCGDARAQQAAARFDEILAAIAGVQPDAELVAAASVASQEMGLPASREDYREWATERAIEEAQEAGLDPAETGEEAWDQANAVFDAWQATARAVVDAVLEEEADSEEAWAMPAPSRYGEDTMDGSGQTPEEEPSFFPQNSVNCVNLAARDDRDLPGPRIRIP